jgi:hypothetical protein
MLKVAQPAFNHTPSISESFFLKNGFNSPAPNRASKSNSNAANTGLPSYSLDKRPQVSIADPEEAKFVRYLQRQIAATERLDNHRQCKIEIEKKLREFGFIEQADSIKKCCSVYQDLACPNGHGFRRVPTYRCFLPLCPDCARRKANQAVKRVAPKIYQALRNNPDLLPVFLTLTIKSSKKRDLRAGNRQIKKCFKTLRNRQIWDDNIAGGFGRVENTFNPKEGWHPHIHCLTIQKCVPQSALSDAWKSITGDSYIVDIKRVYDVSAGILEVIKYPYKPADLKKLSRLEIEQIFKYRGDRLGITFGELHGIKIDDDLADNDDYAEMVGLETVSDLRPGDGCPICGAELYFRKMTAAEMSQFYREMKLPRPVPPNGFI